MEAQGQCTYDPTWDDATLVERAWGCRAGPDLRRALVLRGDRVAPHILEFARHHTEARGWALELFEELGAGGDRAYASLGPALVDWQVSGFSSGSPTADARRLKEVGPAATPLLLAHLPDLCATGNTRVLGAIATTADPAAVPGLAAVAEQRGCERHVRLVAAQLLVRLNQERGVAVLQRLLGERAMSPERGAIAMTLARAGRGGGVGPAIEVLKDPAVSRSQRWDLAELLRATGLPEAVTAADRYQPSGRSGTGNPESMRGAWLTAGLVAVCALLLTPRRRDGRLTRGQRIGIVTVAVLVAHVASLASYFAIGIVPTFYSPALLLFGAIALGAVLPVCLVLGAVRRGWDLTSLSPSLMAVAAVAGVVLGCYFDEQVYWYTARKDEQDLVPRYFSALQQVVAWTLPLVASYWPHPSVWSDARSVGEAVLARRDE